MSITHQVEIYEKSNNVIRILQVTWHPYTDTHVAILSSDSVLRYERCRTPHGTDLV
ncbi:hypothetical protein BVRB_6g135370 [Beta vulgaris subsp. vulgaris]|nr:hypothetical protein BVRB_6g135370 [Beta vulgaris subsp. vulgaris]